MKKAITEEELKKCSTDFQTRVDAIKADKICIDNSLKVNNEVESADIHELFAFYDQAFFGGVLDGKILLEWSNRMT